MMQSSLAALLLLLPGPLLLASRAHTQEEQTDWEWALDQLPHHRTKRFLWLTEEKRLVMPPGSQLVLTPTLALPFLRYPPTGLDANMTISTPFTINFDKMGLTDNTNPLGVLPYLTPFLDLIASSGKRKRDIPEPDVEPHSIHGGERAALYEYVEDYLFTFGMDGKSCLLRAICEMHESPLLGYGIFGELLEVFLTPSRSSYQQRMTDYISAERAGKHEGECWRYERDCTRSLFKLSKYSREAQKTPQKIQLEQFLSPNFPGGNEIM